MLGAILGDIIGSRFEFSNTAINKDFKLYTKDSTYTDDTVMTLAIADALMCVNNRYDENEVKTMIIQKMKTEELLTTSSSIRWPTTTSLLSSTLPILTRTGRGCRSMPRDMT